MSKKAVVSQMAPEFELLATGGKTIKLSQLRGQKVVLYFYPKDATSGCTLEGQNFRDMHAKFKEANAVILGVSRDSVKSHDTFKENECFPFDLLSDPDEVLCTLFDAMKMKNMYGKQVRGVDRSTFLIDEEGVLRREWRGVKVDGHVAEVLEAVNAL